MKKVKFDELPITREFLREKRMAEERGEVALISDGKVFCHLGYFTLKRGHGYFRGGHYHLKKVEHIYIISGRLLVKFVDIDTGERFEKCFRDGHRITIYPKCAHLFIAEEEVRAIEYYRVAFDPTDNIPFSDF